MEEVTIEECMENERCRDCPHRECNCPKVEL